MLPRPTAMLFDVGDTLLQERRFDLEAGIGAVVSDPTNRRSLAEAYRAHETASHARGVEPLLAEWLRFNVADLAWQPIADIEDRVWRAVVTLVPYPSTTLVLSHLAANGVRLAALSNAAFSGRVLSGELGLHRLAHHLQFVLSSADLGVRKPAESVFRVAIERLGATACTTWFVGDTIEEDVAGATSVGMLPILFWPPHRQPPPPSDVPVVHDWPQLLSLYVATMSAHAR